MLMNKEGFKVGGDPQTAICPVMIGDEGKTNQMANGLLKEGILVISFTYPIVAKGQA